MVKVVSSDVKSHQLVAVDTATPPTVVAATLQNVSNVNDQCTSTAPQQPAVVEVSAKKRPKLQLQLKLQDSIEYGPLTQRDELKNRLQKFDNKLKFRELSHDGYIEVPSARFSHVKTAEHTLVVAPDGQQLPANRMQINGRDMAIATQYPKAEDLESYFKMLVDNRVPVLAVLASDHEITDPFASLPAYFKEDAQYGNVAVQVDKQEQISLDGLTLQHYQMKVMVEGKNNIIPVIHATDWPDREAITVEQSQKLAECVMQFKDNHHNASMTGEKDSVDELNKSLPVIHCRAGIGRTGQLIAAMALVSHANSGVEYSAQSVIKDMRRSRNHYMVHTPSQIESVLDLAEELKQPILKRKFSS